MYVPKHFAIKERDELVGLIRSEPFGILVSADGAEPVASHLPFAVRDGDSLVLIAHLARANSHWESLDGARVLAIFHGPHAMISASWYARPAESVPTWNYSAVHCAGRARVVAPEETHRILQEMTDAFERDWNMEIPDAQYIARMERGVVGIEIDVDAIEGKLKFSQNRTEEDRERVIAHLKNSPAARDREVAEQMAQLSSKGLIEIE